MLKHDTIEIEIKQNYKHYEELGYPIKKELDAKKRIRVPRQKIIVKVSDLPDNSTYRVDLICDICGCEFTQRYADYTRIHKKSDLDCCGKQSCKSKKMILTKLEKYGTLNPVEISKINGTNVGRNPKYGIEDIVDMACIKNYTIVSDLPNRIVCKDHIKLRCNKHCVEFSIPIYNLMNEDVHNCKLCASESISVIKSQSTIEDVSKICNEKDYTLLTNHINNCDDSVYYICNKHPEYGIQKTSLFGLKNYKNNCKLCHQPRGENHHNWHGGIANDRERDNDSFEYKRWRTSVFKRDNYTCQCCGAIGKINAHHVMNYSSNEELRYVTQNGITLCEECHLNCYEDSFHKIYGTRNNTIEQLQEYFDYKRDKLHLPHIDILEEIINKSD